MAVVTQVAIALITLPALYIATIWSFPRHLSALQPKRRGWVLTLWSSAFLTLASLPFLAAFMRCGGDIPAFQAAAEAHKDTAVWMCVLFGAFLIEDTILGHALGTITILTGFVHHSVYTLVVLYAIASSQAYIFALCAFLELPTFLLALGTIVPKARSDRLFAVVFALTRLALHAWILASFAREAFGAENPVAGRGVVALISLALILHIHWFANNIKGMVARHRLASTPSSPFPTPRTSAALSVPPLLSLASASLPTDVHLSPSGSSAVGSEEDLLATPYDGTARDSGWDLKTDAGGTGWIPVIVI